MNTQAKFIILDKRNRTVGLAAAESGRLCVINGLPLGKYKLIQYEAPDGLCINTIPYYFKLEYPCCTRILRVPAGVCTNSHEKDGCGMNQADVAIKVMNDCVTAQN